MSYSLHDLNEELILIVCNFLDIRDKYKVICLNKYFNKILKDDLYFYLDENLFGNEPIQNGDILINYLNNVKEYSTLVIPPLKYYIDKKNFTFSKSVNLVSSKRYANIVINSYITFAAKKYFRLKNIEILCDFNNYENDCVIFSSNNTLNLSCCRIYTFTNKTINVINSTLIVFDSLFEGNRIINAYLSRLNIKNNDFINSIEAIYADSCKSIINYNYIKNCINSGVTIYQGLCCFRWNSITDNKKHGIKLLNIEKAALISNKINRNSKNGIYIIESNRIEIEDNNINANERSGIRISSLVCDANIGIVNNYISYNVNNGIFLVGGDNKILNNNLNYNLGVGIYSIGINGLIDYNTIKNEGVPCVYLKKCSFRMNENKLCIHNCKNEVIIN